MNGHLGLTILVHGMSKSGKSFLGDTSPAPRLILDAESGSRFTPSKKKLWDPSTPPPEPDDSWDTAIVAVRSFRDVTRSYEWLNSGKHPFKSVVCDSLSEIQTLAIGELAGTKLLKIDEWGQILRVLSDVVRKYRDLVTNPIQPLSAVVFIAMTKQAQDGVWRPYVQGQLATWLPYLVDACVFLAAVPQEDGSVVRRLFIAPIPGYETGERVGGRLGQYMDNPSVSTMLDMVRNGNESSKE